MKKILNKIGQVLQVVLKAPVKLPAKALSILTYVAVGLGILEKVLDDDKSPEINSEPVEQGRTPAQERRGEDETE
ncbi:hypothetical protein [Sphingobacterium siyangense]|uniref:hypothetical protein n=1 Tax=Sphingobacterium siyangense TaxID=459529 RepID=UPI003C71210C